MSTSYEEARAVMAQISPERLAEFDRANECHRPGVAADRHPEPPSDPGAATGKRRRGMNKTEQRYADRLEAHRLAGIVLWWAFEPMRFHLGGGRYFRPDFVIVWPWGIEAVEVKGFLREAAGLRFDLAAERFPWIKWVMVRWTKGEWVTIRAHPTATPFADVPCGANP